MVAPARNANLVTRTTIYRHGTRKAKPFRPNGGGSAIKGSCIKCKRVVPISVYGVMYRHKIDRYIHCLAGEPVYTPEG